MAQIENIKAEDVKAVAEHFHDSAWKDYEKAGKPADHIYHAVVRLKQATCNHSEHDYEDINEGLLVECNNCDAQYEMEPTIPQPEDT